MRRLPIALVVPETNALPKLLLTTAGAPRGSVQMRARTRARPLRVAV